MPAHLQIFQQLKSQWSKYHGLGKRLSRKMPTLVYESTASSRSSGIIDQHSGPERSENERNQNTNLQRFHEDMIAREGMQHGNAAKKGSTIESVELSCSDASRVPFPLVSYSLKMRASHLAK